MPSGPGEVDVFNHPSIPVKGFNSPYPSRPGNSAEQNAREVEGEGGGVELSC